MATTTEQMTVGIFRQRLELAKAKIAAVLPRHLKGEEGRILTLAYNEWQSNPDLQKCEPITIINCLIQAARLGLEVNSPLNQADLIPYGKVCQLQIRYGGYVELMYRTGKVLDVSAEVVREHDQFDYELGTKQFLRHKPAPAEERGELTHVWAMIELAITPERAVKKFIVMDREQVEHVQLSSKTGIVWKTYREEQWKKTAIKRIRKLAPMSKDLARAAQLDDEAEIGEPQRFDVEIESAGIPSAQEIRNGDVAEKTQQKMDELRSQLERQRNSQIPPQPSDSPDAERGASASVPPAKVPQSSSQALQESAEKEGAGLTGDSPGPKQTVSPERQRFLNVMQSLAKSFTVAYYAALGREGYEHASDVPETIQGRIEAAVRQAVDARSLLRKRGRPPGSGSAKEPIANLPAGNEEFYAKTMKKLGYSSKPAFDDFLGGLLGCLASDIGKIKPTELNALLKLCLVLGLEGIGEASQRKYEAEKARFGFSFSELYQYLELSKQPQESWLVMLKRKDIPASQLGSAVRKSLEPKEENGSLGRGDFSLI